MKDNPHLKTGFRVCFHTYYDCARSLFMLHNETMNVWSHLIGASIFVFMAFYVLIYLKPTSLHESASIVSRWSSGFDQGKFDQLFCDREDFNFPKPDSVPTKPKSCLTTSLRLKNSWPGTLTLMPSNPRTCSTST